MSQISEDDLITRFFAPLAAPGGLRLMDDAALLRVPAGQDLVLTKDALVAGVHFFAHDPPADIARKALRVNLSDLAAKGADPVGFLLAIALPKDWTSDWLGEFARGLGADAASYGLPLLGGDTVRTPGPLMVCITALGQVPQGTMVPRTGVQAGDSLFVTGTIGDAALGLRLRMGGAGDAAWLTRLRPASRDFLADRYLRPRPRNALAHLLRAHAHAAMDVSDGFVGDMRKMLKASGMGGVVQLASVPLSPAVHEALRFAPQLLTLALTGGDDYEIICAVPQQRAADFEAGAAGLGIALARIGQAGGAAARFLDAEGDAVAFASGSFSHF